MSNPEHKPTPTTPLETASMPDQPEQPVVEAAPELTPEQLEQYAAASHAEVDRDSAEVVLQAEIRIAAEAEKLALGEEEVRAVRAEAGTDAELASIGEEATRLAAETKLAIDAPEGAVSGSETAGSSAEQSPEQAKRVEEVREQLLRQPNESQPVYLFRVGKEITAFLSTSRVFDVNRVTEASLSDTAKELIGVAVQEAGRAAEAPIQVDAARNEEALKRIEGKIGVHSVAAAEDPHDTNTFDKTQRNRMLFEIQPGRGSAKRETYWNTLVFAFNTAETRALAKKMLDGKSVLLLGGGRARLGEEMRHNEITPKDVLNADPFVENVESGADAVVPVSSADETLPARLQEQGMEQADEIWAEFSVPAYLDRPEEIIGMFQNMDTVLAAGGTARIWPLEVKRGTPEEVDARKEALQASLRELVKMGNYELITYEAAGRMGITLRKAEQQKKAPSEPSK